MYVLFIYFNCVTTIDNLPYDHNHVVFVLVFFWMN